MDTVSLEISAQHPAFAGHFPGAPIVPGALLLDEAVHQARAWPADAIRLDAFDANAGAGEFYAKCGFREVGRVIYRKNPLIYYELVL